MDTKKQKRRGPGALDVFIVLALLAVIAGVGLRAYINNTSQVGTAAVLEDYVELVLGHNLVVLVEELGVDKCLENRDIVLVVACGGIGVVEHVVGNLGKEVENLAALLRAAYEGTQQRVGIVAGDDEDILGKGRVDVVDVVLLDALARGKVERIPVVGYVVVELLASLDILEARAWQLKATCRKGVGGVVVNVVRCVCPDTRREQQQ